MAKVELNHMSAVPIPLVVLVCEVSFPLQPEPVWPKLCLTEVFIDFPLL